MADTGFNPVPHDAAFRNTLLAKPGVKTVFDARGEEYTALHSIGAAPKAVWFDDDALWVRLTDGRTIGVPLAWFPRLLDATPEQRAMVELSESGLRWDALGEDILVAGLLAGQPDVSRSKTCKVGHCQPTDKTQTKDLTQTANTQPSRLMLSPKALQKALKQSAKQAQRLADAFGVVVPSIKPKASRSSHAPS